MVYRIAPDADRNAHSNNTHRLQFGLSPLYCTARARAAMALVALSGDEQRITRAEAERQQSEMVSVASLFREAVQVAPAADEVDALPAVSMVALPNELLQHIFK